MVILILISICLAFVVSSGGRFEAIGESATLLERYSHLLEEGKKVDLLGRHVFPGFIDSHAVPTSLPCYF